MPGPWNHTGGVKHFGNYAVVSIRMHEPIIVRKGTSKGRQQAHWHHSLIDPTYASDPERAWMSEFPAWRSLLRHERKSLLQHRRGHKQLA